MQHFELHRLQDERLAAAAAASGTGTEKANSGLKPSAGHISDCQDCPLGREISVVSMRPAAPCWQQAILAYQTRIKLFEF